MEVTLLVVRVCPFVPSKTKCRPQDRNKNKAEEDLENIDGIFIAYINPGVLERISIQVIMPLFISKWRIGTQKERLITIS